MSTFTVGNVSVSGYEALPASGSGSGIIVLHAWWGLNTFFKEFCDRLAAEGFVVVAPDLYHGTVADSIEEAESLSSNLDQARAFQEIAATAEYLKNHPSNKTSSLGVVGFSLGAFFALRVAQNLPQDIAAVVLFYGTGDGAYDKAQAAFLGHYAENDPYEALEYVQATENALREAAREVEFHTYPGTGHWFFEPNRADAYNADAARTAWERTVAFLKQKLQ